MCHVHQLAIASVEMLALSQAVDRIGNQREGGTEFVTYVGKEAQFRIGGFFGQAMFQPIITQHQYTAAHHEQEDHHKQDE